MHCYYGISYGLWYECLNAIMVLFLQLLHICLLYIRKFLLSLVRLFDGTPAHSYNNYIHSYRQLLIYLYLLSYMLYLALLN